ncbi:putative tail structure protein [Roseobacter phage CRP-738]|nr:putative tail structure protein [Roseobacter phage CRP-738]
MPSTYLNLCNMVLRRINEVEIAQADFGTVRGVQALVKDSVRAAIAKINQAEFEWPFNASEHTQVLTAGRTEYDWPDYFKIADFNSFQIQKDDSLATGYKTLSAIERDDWYRDYRDTDYEAGSAGRGVPDFVFPSHGTGFGVTPSPDKAYSVRFRYYLNYADLTAHDDVTRIPESFDTVIVDGALYHLYMFKDNLDAANAAFIAFQSGLKDLQTLYINSYQSVRDTRIKF